MSDQEKLVVEYVPAPSYVTAYAQNVVSTGPTADGLVQIHFVRDMFRLAPDHVLKTNSKNAVGVDTFQVTQDPTAQPQPTLYREIVASISVPAATLRAIAELLHEMADRAAIPRPNTATN